MSTTAHCGNSSPPTSFDEVGDGNAGATVPVAVPVPAQPVSFATPADSGKIAPFFLSSRPGMTLELGKTNGPAAIAPALTRPWLDAAASATHPGREAKRCRITRPPPDVTGVQLPRARSATR